MHILIMQNILIFVYVLEKIIGENCKDYPGLGINAWRDINGSVIALSKSVCTCMSIRPCVWNLYIASKGDDGHDEGKDNR